MLLHTERYGHVRWRGGGGGGWHICNARRRHADGVGEEEKTKEKEDKEDIFIYMKKAFAQSMLFADKTPS